MAIRMKSKKNLMDFVPERNPKFGTEITEEGYIRILILRNGIIDKVVRRFKGTPDTLKVDLDNFGSFVWQSIDGKRDVYEIGNLLKEHFGDEIEPVYERLGQFMNLLKNNDFITYHYKQAE